MNSKLALRVALDLTAFILLLVALAYYWLDNLTHEVVGTAMFILLMAHNTLNRRWYKGVPKRQEPRKTVDKLLVFCLLAAMVVLLVTSVMISQTIFAAIALPDALSARRIHMVAAYWALLLVAIHLGIRWRVVLGFARSVVGPGGGWMPAPVVHLTAAALAAAGVYSSFEIGVGGKLVAQMSLDGWDFMASTTGFFLHHIAIVGLYMYLAHHSSGRG